MPLTNRQLSELLAAEAETAKGHLQRAYRRASRRAYMWRKEAAEMAESGESLRQLEGIGPFLARRMHEWLDEPPEVQEAPELRRDFLTYTDAQSILSQHPEYKGARGDLQMHTTWSDGYGTLYETAEAAAAYGHEYISITDHSKGLKIAKGIDEEELARQGKAIAALNSDFEKGGIRLRVLRSVELNLDVTGTGDMEPESMMALDLVLASFHSSLRKKEDQTDRYLAAIRNPQIHILGHPKGRIFNFRAGLTADWRVVFGEAAALGKAVEIDSFPDRQDLSVSLLGIAADAGVMISIGTDAHHPSQFWFLDFGLAAAAAAGIPRDRILNYMSADQLLDWAEGSKSASSVPA